MHRAQPELTATVSDRLCAGIAIVRPADLAPSVLHAATRALLDATGVMLGASGLAPEIEPFVQLAAGPGPCSILGTGLSATAPLAALANGAMAHALDFEDAFDLAPGHPNASLVPALIALAQAEGPVDGPHFLTALVLGGDLACRMGLALRQKMELGGWYPPPILASFGAAAGCAKLLGLDARGIRDALSLTLCQATMPGEIKYSEGTVLRAVREAFGAQAAVNSAQLARSGVAGFEQPLEGRAGFYALFAGGQFSEDALLDGLGRQFWIEQLTFKSWPSCRGTHPYIELALSLKAQHGIDPAGIAKILASHDGVQRMLVEPLARKRAPGTIIDAKFSIPFATALALLRGRVGLDEFVPAALADPQVLALAARVETELVADPPWREGVGGALRIEMTDGRVWSASLDEARGSPARPLADTELVEKFVDCAGRARVPMTADSALKLANAILALESCPDVGALFSAATARPPAAAPTRPVDLPSDDSAFTSADKQALI